MNAYLAAIAALAVCGGAAASGLSACATGADTPPTTNGFAPPTGGTSTSSSGGGSSSGSSTPDATVPSGSSGGYGDDSSNASSSSGASSSSSSSGGDDGGGQPTPGPTCTTGQACVDGIPSGWSGFVQLLLGGAGDAGAACAAPYGSVQPSLGGQTDPDGGPATCGSCNCYVPDAGVTCSVGLGINNLGCIPKTGGPTTPADQGACVANPSLPSGEVTAPKLSAGTCQAGPVLVTTAPPPATWTTATACASAGDGGSGGSAEGGAAGTGQTCNPGQACAALPSGADGGAPSGVCVYQAGVQTCPPSGTTAFTNTFVVGAVEDSRGCGCTCGTLTCPADGYVAGYTTTNCSGTPSLRIDAGTACAGNISPKSFMYFPSRSGSLGTCGGATGGPSGQVDIDAGTATTFCCVP